LVAGCTIRSTNRNRLSRISIFRYQERPPGLASQSRAPSGKGRPFPNFGIRIGSARDGKVTAFIEDMESTTPRHSGAEGVGADAQANVYDADGAPADAGAACEEVIVRRIAARQRVDRS
jgi:hypothetical protein